MESGLIFLSPVEPLGKFCWYGYEFGIFKTVLNSSQEMKQSWVFKN